MKAIILAAGQGTRLRPVTLTMPKPLVPVANKPLILYSIDFLKNAGINEIGIVVNSLESPICSQLGDGKQHDVSIQYIVQEVQLGLAHAAGLCKDFLAGEPFCMLLGDNIFQDKMPNLFKKFLDSGADVAVALAEVSDPSRFGIAVLEDGKICKVIEKPKEPPSNLAILGVYLFRPSIFDAIANIKPSGRGEYEITDAIQYQINHNRMVQPYVLEGWWIDAGKPDAINYANQLVLGELPFSPAPEGDFIQGKSEIGPRVILGENVQIIDSVIRGPVIIGNNVTVRNSYVGPYTSLGNNVIVENSEIEASIVMKDCTLRSIAGRIDSSLIADNSEVCSSSHHVPSTHRFILAENSYVQL
jgi:glucose-1-phosphate thymidylyltransferase